MSNTRTQKRSSTEVPLSGRRRKKDAPNSLKFFATIEGEIEHDGRIRSANGMRWRVA